MTEPTKAQVLELAKEYEMLSAGHRGLNAICDTIADEHATIARALRLLAETMGREAEPVAWLAFDRGGDDRMLTENFEVAVRHGWRPGYTLKELYASPPPAPGYAEGLEVAARIADEWDSPSALRLAAGEMTAQEMRTERAVVRGVSARIRALKEG